MKQSTSIAALAAALAKAQGAMEGAKKDSNNPFFKSKYADLSSVVDAIKLALSANGLSYSQFPCTSDKDEAGVETILMHSSGEWICGEPFYVPVTKSDAQGFGSALTYARRYSLQAAVGIAAEDDDGNAAAAAKPERPNTATQVAVDAFEGMGDEQQAFLHEQAKSVIHLFETKGDAHGWLEAQNFDNEEKLALWSLFPSNVRAYIKKQQKEAASA